MKLFFMLVFSEQHKASTKQPATDLKNVTENRPWSLNLLKREKTGGSDA